MGNQDKLFDKIKEASQNAESRDFPAMEKIWSRVEEKLDKKEDKKTIALWKKIAVAASLLLVVSLGFQFLQSDKTNAIENIDKVVINEKETIQKTDLEKNKTAVSQDSGLISKAEAEEILSNPIIQQPTIAANEEQSVNDNIIGYGTSAGMVADEFITPSVSVESDSLSKKGFFKKEVVSIGYSNTPKSENHRIANSDKEVQLAKKSAPLVVLNGKAISHSNDDKRDQMMQEELPNLNPENVESLVILDEPLYIIDGNYYSEEDLFGKNPKSPYAPLNKQEIKTITILQDLESTSKYGEKGKKGVVIITTKTGKPATQK